MSTEETAKNEEEPQEPAAEQAAAPVSETGPADNAQDAAQDSVLGFLQDISAFLDADTIRFQTRATRQGVFLEEALYQPFLNGYQSWLESQGAHGTHVSEHKLVRRLFGSEDPQLFYLIEGKLCLAGYLVEYEGAQQKRLPSPAYQGSLQSARDSLHLRDPILQQLEGIRSVVDARGFRLLVERSDGNIEVTPEILARLGKLARFSKPFQKRHPEIFRALRAGLPALGEIVKGASPLKNSASLLIPGEFRKAESLKYLRAGDFVLVVDPDRRVKDVYAIKGKNLMFFVSTEVRHMAERLGTKRINSFQFSKKRSEFGSMKIEDTRFHVPFQVFFDFLCTAPHSKRFRKLFRSRYTVHDGLRILLEALAKSEWREAFELPRHLVSGHPKEKYRRSEDWLLRIDQRYRIISFEDMHARPRTQDKDNRGQRRAGGRQKRDSARKGGGKRGKKPTRKPAAAEYSD